MASKNPITLRTSEITGKQIADLSQRWGENKSQVIVRSIDRAWVNELKLIRNHGDPGNSSAEQTTQTVNIPIYENVRSKLFLGDARSILAGLDSESIDCVVTSPPYFGQRDYEAEGQIGLEDHPDMYIANLVSVFQEVKRVLKSSGSLWVNLGDTYWSGKGRSHGVDEKQKYRRFTRPQDKSGIRPWGVPKQLLLIPHRFAIAMQENGWRVRGDNVWYKPNPTPDPVDDRCARAHEYMFHFVKDRHYWFDSEAVAVASNGNSTSQPPHSVWTIKTTPSKKTHKASFPKELVSLPLKATLPPKGVFLDPFCGSGTALLYALQLSPHVQAFGIDISKTSILEAQGELSRLAS